MEKRLHTFGFTCFIFIATNFLFSVKSFSQSLIFGNEKVKVEAGFNIGPSFFLGDLGGNAGKGERFIKDVNLELTKVIKGVFITVYPNVWLGIRIAAQTGKLDGKDNIINTKGVDELWRKQRNLDFKSTLSEAYIAAEIFPLMMLRKYEDYEPRLRPYGIIGIGVFHFNPQGSITGANGNKSWYYLQPLRTEGQGTTEYPARNMYSLTQVNVPMGGGFKYFLSDKVNISFEVLLRKTFTDYIDDVSTEYIDPDLFDKYLSAPDALIARQIHDKTYGIVTPGVSRYEPGTQRGNPRQNDSYFSLLMKFGIRLGQVYESSYERNVAGKTKCRAVRF